MTTKVFVSYSHDSDEHKRWVAAIAEEIQSWGYEVILDQWKTFAGMDLLHFMERAIREADKVVVICSESYVRKAESRKGGVGYEGTILTAELASDLGTTKFIPVIRRSDRTLDAPNFLNSRIKIQMSEGANSTALSELRNAISEQPSSKPGAIVEAINRSALLESSADELDEQGDQSEEQWVSYLKETLKTGAWREWDAMFRQEKRNADMRLSSIRAELDAAARTKDWSEVCKEVVEAYGRAIAIIGVTTSVGSSYVNPPLSKLQTLFEPEAWNRSGLNRIGDLPKLVFLSAIYIYGALAWAERNTSGLVDLYSHVFMKPSGVKKCINDMRGALHFSSVLANDGKETFRFVNEVLADLGAVRMLFFDSGEYRSALSKFYVSWDVFDFLTACGNSELKENWKEVGGITPTVPPYFLYRFEDRELVDSYSEVLRDPVYLKSVWDEVSIPMDVNVGKNWKTWVMTHKRMLNDARIDTFLRDDFFKDLSERPPVLR